MNSAEKDYLNREFRIEIKKEKGKLNTLQTYEFREVYELLVGIASMTEQLISRKIIREDEIKEAVEMGVKKAKCKSLDL